MFLKMTIVLYSAEPYIIHPQGQLQPHLNCQAEVYWSHMCHSLNEGNVSYQDIGLQGQYKTKPRYCQ